MAKAKDKKKTKAPAPKASPKKEAKKPVMKASAKKEAPKKVEKPVEKAVKAAKPIPQPAAKAEKAEKKPIIVVQEAPVVDVEAPEEEESDEVVLTDAEGRRYCRVRDCDQLSTVDAYCRYHYLLHWKKIQVRKKILTEGKLERYIEELTARYPDKYLDMLKKDLRSEKDFLGAIAELEIDESAGDGDFEEEQEGFIDEVRGISSESGTTREEEEF
jgi:hypothetical protein